MYHVKEMISFSKLIISYLLVLDKFVLGLEMHYVSLSGKG